MGGLEQTPLSYADQLLVISRITAPAIRRALAFVTYTLFVAVR